jgi:hypothetical protein
MTQILLFCSLTVSGIFLNSCNNRDLDCKRPRIIDTGYSYTVKDFESMCESLKGKEMSKAKLKCTFQSKFDSSTSSNTTVFKFILWKRPEVIDTCWGVIQYTEGDKMVNDYSVICQ